MFNAEGIEYFHLFIIIVYAKKGIMMILSPNFAISVHFHVNLAYFKMIIVWNVKEIEKKHIFKIKPLIAFAMKIHLMIQLIKEIKQ